MKLKLTQAEVQRIKSLYSTDAAKYTSDRAKIEGVKAEELSTIESPKAAYDHLTDRVKNVRGIFDSNGFDARSGSFVTMEDALTHYDSPIVLPKVIDQMLIEPIEPLLTVSKAFTVVSGSDVESLMAQWPALGSIEADDMALTQEYPERYLTMDGGFAVSAVGKVGVATKIAQETIRESRYDLVGLHVRAMGAALARKKEKKSWTVLNSTGQLVFSNYNQAGAVFGATTGRSRDGTFNGAITGDDLFKAWAHSASQGFPFSQLFCHPLAWTLFARDPLTRQFALAGLAQYYNALNGSASGPVPQYGNGLGITGGYDNTASEFSFTANSTAAVPGYIPMPLSIIPTPFASFDAATMLTDIIAVSPGNVGVIVQKEGVTTGSWEDPARDILKIKASERYGFGVPNMGLGVYRFEGVKVDLDTVFLSPMIELTDSTPVVAANGTLANFTRP